MRTFPDCVPCFMRQTLEAARMAVPDERVHERILRAVLERTASLSYAEAPPALSREIHALVRSISGNPDPYREVKRRFNAVALAMRADLAERVRRSARPFETAARLAIAGNVIDFGIGTGAGDVHLPEAVESGLTQPFAVNDLDALQAAAERAERVLYLADNAGEIVLDRLLVEMLPAGRVTVAVKSGPIINDATIEDAAAAGLAEVAEVVETGLDAPGTILRGCSEDFQARFEAADLVIAKGQGNYETLDESGKRGLFFLLRAKCPVVARDLGCAPGSVLVKANERGT